MRRPLLAATLSLLAVPCATALAAPPVVTDIAPVHALAARVMDGVATPELLIAPGTSPHGYSLRPSDARRLQDAQIIFWVGEALTPWLEDTLETLGQGATVAELMGADGTVLLPVRESARFEAHDHGKPDAAHNHTHGHSHAHTHAHGAQDHDGIDPHVWLDPMNARVWLGAMAEALATADPANAAAYRANAAAGQAEIDALVAEIGATLAPVAGRGFIVFHDAYQYFEARFGMQAAGAISLSDATTPSAARVAEIRETIVDLDALCVFSEPQFEPRLVATVTEATNARRGVLDPVGAALEPGAGFYPALLRGLAASMAECLR
jgi:zinc transport system substrate-binding protein